MDEARRQAGQITRDPIDDRQLFLKIFQIDDVGVLGQDLDHLGKVRHLDEPA